MPEKISTLGLGGMDALSFFESSKPRRGTFDYKAEVGGMTYCFSSQSNLDRFVRRPEAFLPQFGGHCAFYCGLMGRMVPGDARAWRIVNGKLYLASGPNVAWLWDKLPMLVGRGHDNYRTSLRGRPKGALKPAEARAAVRD